MPRPGSARCVCVCVGGGLQFQMIGGAFSFRSDYTPSFYQNGKESTSPTSVEHFSFSDLPNLDFGSPDEDEGSVCVCVSVQFNVLICR